MTKAVDRNDGIVDRKLLRNFGRSGSGDVFAICCIFFRGE
jgi:hypothetical protein